MNGNHFVSDRESRIRPGVLPVGIAVLFLLLSLPYLIPGFTGSAGIWSLAILEVGVFLLFTASVATRRVGSAPHSPRWLSPGLPLVLLIALGVLSLPRATQPTLAAEGLLLGITGYLLFRLLVETDRLPSREPLFLFSLVAPATLVAVSRLLFPPDVWVKPVEEAVPSVWILLAIPLALRGASQARLRIYRASFLLAVVLLGGSLLRFPPPLGWIILALSGAASLLIAFFPRTPGPSESSPRTGAERSLPMAAIGSLLGILLLGGVILLSPWPGKFSPPGLILHHPLGVGPGNLPEALAPDMKPPAVDENPLTPWPDPRVGDLPRLQTELGWWVTPLLLWVLVAIWTTGTVLTRLDPSRQTRSGSASLMMAILAGTLCLFLDSPLKTPAAVAIFCWIAAFTTGCYRRARSGGASLPDRSEPAGGFSGTGRRTRAVWTTAAALLATGIVALGAGQGLVTDHRLRSAHRGYLSGNLQAARRHAEKALDLHPEHFRARALLAAILRAGGDCRGATRHYHRILERSPADARISLQLLDCYEDLGFVSDGVRLSQELADRWPSSLEIGTAHARWLARDGQRERAEEEYRRVIELEMDFGPANFGLAELLQETDRSEEAVFHYRRAALANPMDPETFIRMGDIRYSQRRFEAATKYYAAAVNVARDDPEALLRAGSAFFMVDRKCTALSLLEQARDLGLSEETLKEIQPHMEAMRAECPTPEPEDPPEDP